jgi:hypothetical protein
MERTDSIQLTHVALLVQSVRSSAKTLEPHGFHIGPEEKWDGEGTLEIYVGEKQNTSRLLLMEPVKEGAYTRALKKRGPGLHHIGVDVLSLESYIDELSGSGWFLHPKSLKTIRDTQTAWLVRPGIPFMVEVQERESLKSAEKFISKIELPLSPKDHQIVLTLGIDGVDSSTDQKSWLQIQSHRIAIETLVRASQ